MVGSTALFLAMPGIVRRTIEGLEGDITARRLVTAAGTILLLAIGDAILFYFTRTILIGASRDIEYEMRRDLFAHFLRLPSPWYRKNRVGDLMSRAVNDLAAVRMLLGPGIMQAANTIVVGTASIVLMARVSLPLTGVALAMLPLVALATTLVGAATHRRFTRIQEIFSEISNAAQESFTGVRVLRAFAREKAEEERFAKQNRDFLEKNLGLARLNALYFPFLQLLVGIGFALVLYVGGRFILAGTFTVARFVEFHLYLVELIWPAMALGWVVNLWQRGSASWNRMVELWEAAPQPEEQDLPVTLPGDLAVAHMTVGYDEGTATLHDVSLHVRAGETVALAGRTGAGKSTLLGLLPRLEDPPKGTVFIGGRDVTELPLPTVRRHVAMVPQETILFSDTLAANIAFGKPGATREEIEAAARDAGLGPDLERFPKGLETMVGERGITLSGGQKQRTALARALLSEAPLLVLDDAFSSVDTETEERILEALASAKKGRTVLLVSHRLSTLQHADRIVFFERGRVVESGTHAELLARGGAYAAFAERQRLSEEVEAA